MGPGCVEESADLRSFESDRRSFRIVLVIDVGVRKRPDDGVVVDGHGFNAGEGQRALRLEAITGDRLVDVSVGPSAGFVARHGPEATAPRRRRRSSVRSEPAHAGTRFW